MNVDATSLRPRLMDFYHTAHARAAADIYQLVGYVPSDVDLVQIYDSFDRCPIQLRSLRRTPTTSAH